MQITNHRREIKDYLNATSTWNMNTHVIKDGKGKSKVEKAYFKYRVRVFVLYSFLALSNQAC